MKKEETYTIIIIIFITIFIFIIIISEILLHTCTLQEFKNVDTSKEASFSLTTTPSRFNNIQPTLDSLIKQNPKNIYLNIPYVFKKTGEEYIIPKWLELYKKVTIIRCEDQGPSTKFMGLFNHKINPEEYICVVDDDQVYNDKLLNNLLFKSKLYDGNYVISQLIYPFPTRVIGSHSYLFKRKLIDDLLYFHKTTECNQVDDSWISAYFKHNNIDMKLLFPVCISNVSIRPSPTNLFQFYKNICYNSCNGYNSINALYKNRDIEEDRKCETSIKTYYVFDNLYE